MNRLSFKAAPWLILSYICAIVVANLLVTAFGPPALGITALVLIPFDMIARDQLHENWTGRNLRIKMLALIISGGVISYLLNSNSVNIAVASCLTFLVAGTSDYIVYSYVKEGKFKKMVSSNLVSAVVDSVMFQIIAFGAFSTVVATQQIVLKAIGTVFWAYMFVRLFVK